MKKIYIILMIFLFAKIDAQTYKISFAGTGASLNVDSIKVENLTEKTTILLNGGDTLNLTVATGIKEISNNSGNTLLISPNPMQGNCMIEFDATAQGEATIELYDIAGKRILQLNEILMKGHQKYSLSITGSGIYELKVESDEYSYAGKIVSSNSTSGINEIKHIEAGSIEQGAGSIEGLKSIKSGKDLQYNQGDILRLTGYATGIYTTVVMLIPTQSKLVTFDFGLCEDADGNNYPIVQIGNRWWMEQNLKTTDYNNGPGNDRTAIPTETDNTLWLNLNSAAYCWYENNFAEYANIYGALYNYWAVQTGLLCPTGWHVPDSTEWTVLLNYLGGTNNAGYAMIEPGTTTNNLVTDSCGFSGLPAGYRGNTDGSFGSLGLEGGWWSSTAVFNSTLDHTNLAYSYYILWDAPTLEGLSGGNMRAGVSVRCIKDL